MSSSEGSPTILLDDIGNRKSQGYRRCLSFSFDFYSYCELCLLSLCCDSTTLKGPTITFVNVLLSARVVYFLQVCSETLS